MAFPGESKRRPASGWFSALSSYMPNSTPTRQESYKSSARSWGARSRGGLSIGGIYGTTMARSAAQWTSWRRSPSGSPLLPLWKPGLPGEARCVARGLPSYNWGARVLLIERLSWFANRSGRGLNTFSFSRDRATTSSTGERVSRRYVSRLGGRTPNAALTERFNWWGRSIARRFLPWSFRRSLQWRGLLDRVRPTTSRSSCTTLVWSASNSACTRTAPRTSRSLDAAFDSPGNAIPGA